MATTVSKRYDTAAGKIAPEKQYSLDEAIGVLKAMPGAKFDESVDLSFRLGVDPKHADQMVRGAVVLPHGIGKTVRVCTRLSCSTPSTPNPTVDTHASANSSPAPSSNTIDRRRSSAAR